MDDRVALLDIIRSILAVFNDPELSWETRYDWIFDRNKHAVEPLLNKLSIELDYRDPDTSYQEDATAYVDALRKLRRELEENLQKEIKPSDEKMSKIFELSGTIIFHANDIDDAFHKLASNALSEGRESDLPEAGTRIELKKIEYVGQS